MTEKPQGAWRREQEAHGQQGAREGQGGEGDMESACRWGRGRGDEEPVTSHSSRNVGGGGGSCCLCCLNKRTPSRGQERRRVQPPPH